MDKGIKLDRELEEFLKDSKTTEEIFASLEDLEPLDLEKDPEYVADFMKGMLIEDILKAMEGLNINKSQLAERLGKTRQYVSRVLNETANFTLKSIAEIVCALDMQAQVRIYKKDEVLHIIKRPFQIEVEIPKLGLVDDREYVNLESYNNDSIYKKISEKYDLAG